jgi:hypothetical protein
LTHRASTACLGGAFTDVEVAFPSDTQRGILKMSYVAPSISELGSFRAVTNGIWFGSFRDIFGGRAVIKVIIG